MRTVAAQGGMLTLADNGDVTVHGSPDTREELAPIAEDTRSARQGTDPSGQDIDADCAEVFTNLPSTATSPRSGATDFAGAQQMGRDNPGCRRRIRRRARAPPPQDVKAWWDALSERRADRGQAPNIPTGSAIATGCRCGRAVEVNVAELDPRSPTRSATR